MFEFAFTTLLLTTALAILAAAIVLVVWAYSMYREVKDNEATKFEGIAKAILQAAERHEE